MCYCGASDTELHQDDDSDDDEEEEEENTATCSSSVAASGPETTNEAVTTVPCDICNNFFHLACTSFAREENVTLQTRRYICRWCTGKSKFAALMHSVWSVPVLPSTFPAAAAAASSSPTSSMPPRVSCICIWKYGDGFFLVFTTWRCPTSLQLGLLCLSMSYLSNCLERHPGRVLV